MPPSSFEYVTSNGEGLLLIARDEPMLVEAFIPKEAIDVYFKLNNATSHERQSLVLTNLAAFDRIASGKYHRGELNYRDVAGMRVALVRISLFDISCCSMRLGTANESQSER